MAAAMAEGEIEDFAFAKLAEVEHRVQRITGPMLIIDETWCFALEVCV